MRLLLRLTARADAAYDNAYHHKLRGAIWNALEGTRFDEEHDSGEPIGFAYSNPFPPGDMEEGDPKTVIVASVYEELLSHVAEAFKRNPELNIGEMPFHVNDMSALDVDVGEPGTQGVIETGTGVLVRLYEEHRQKYGINQDEGHGDEPTFWRPEHTTEPFIEAVENNLQRKHEQFEREHLPGPVENDGRLFDEYELIKKFSVPVTVTEGETRNLILSKWRFGYEVRDNHHRRHLNLALDTGIGGRNSLGLGFVNITDKNEVGGRRATT